MKRLLKLRNLFLAFALTLAVVCLPSCKPSVSTEQTTGQNGGTTETQGDSTTETKDGGTTDAKGDGVTGTKDDGKSDAKGDDSKTDSGSKTDSTNKTETVFSGSTDFNSEPWTESVKVDSSFFNDFVEGSQIQITYHLSTTATSYRKIKQNIQTPSSWSELSGGSYENGTYDTTYGGISVDGNSSTVTYTVTSQNVSSLKQYGYALQGYGVVITKVVLISGKNGTSSSGDSGNVDVSDVTSKGTPTTVTGTPFANHGKLHVEGAYLYDNNNEKYMLYGMSTHGITFGNEFSRYINKETFKTLVDDWNTNCIRIVLYPMDYNGYCNGGDKDSLKTLVKNGIDYATELGMYVLVDWHVHAYNPNNTKADAKIFLAEISKEYANYDNVLYEICNEPTSSPWKTTIKPYAEEVIPVIRANAPDSIIIVGTNTYSQDLEDVYQKDESGKDARLDFSNVMYTFHFYANTHQDSYRTRVENAINAGLPVFISEFGTCDASGNGGYNKDESKKWFDLCAKYNISHLNWSLSAKSETASAIVSTCSSVSGWTDDQLTDSGKLIKNHFVNDCTR